ncbi:MAG: hypothetical protein ACXAC8_18590 [Candidatus Hodarchaeales archaeon]|jgi:hypothetical protein
MTIKQFIGQSLPPGTTEIFLIVTGVLIVIIILSGIRVVKEWERAPVYRLGRFIGFKGPGIFWVIPRIDKIPNIITLPKICPECGHSLDYASFPVTKTRIEIGCPSGHRYGVDYEIQDGSISIVRLF